MKVAIVGCKGSGKTVLMSVLGVKYEKPDKNGIFLNPKDKQTHRICNENVGRMQNDAKWPPATSPDATECLQWEIMRKVADDPCDTIADLCFLDFAGEVYTGGWGGDNIDTLSAEAQRSLAQLKFHVKEADVLIVLINLRDIINGQRGDASTDSMEWAARTVLSYAYNEAKTSKVALVFTQSDMYENIIAERGGLQNVLEEYMSNIDARFGNRLALFSVAAVATTEPAPDGGSPLPARNFESKGLEELMLWMADYCLEVRRNELRRMRRKRVRRGFAASIVLLFLLGLFTWKAYNVSPMFRAWVDWQVLAAMELFLPAWVEGSPHPDNPYLKAGEHRNTWVSTRLGYVWTKGTDGIEWSPGLKPSGWPHVTASDNEGIWTLEDGYDWKDPDRVKKGVFSVKWTPGRTHSRNEHLKSDEQEGRWKSTKPGYVWIEGTDKIEWSPGLKPSGWPHVTASDNEGIWTLEDGYEWEFPDRVEKGVLSVKWTPGLKHSKWPHVISGVEEGMWRPEAGYVWKDGEAMKNGDWTVIWKPGLKHPGNEHLESDEQEGRWKSTKPGWVWEEGTDKIKWEKGLKHPGNEHLKSDEQEGKWKSTKPGYVWIEGTDDIKWSPGLKPSGRPHITASDNEGVWIVEDGYYWSRPESVKEGVLSVKWTPGRTHSKWPHVISAVKEGNWRPEAGYVWKDDVEAMKNGDWTVVWKPNMDFGNRKTASKEGEWLTKCDQCRGDGKKIVTRSCNNCFKGKILSKKKCSECNGTSKITQEGSRDCGVCEQKGKTGCLNECEWFSLGNRWVQACPVCNGKRTVCVPNVYFGGWDEYICGRCQGIGLIPCLICSGNGKVCATCDGTGCYRYRYEKECDECKNGYTESQETCQTCNGKGAVDDTRQCSFCETGWR